MDKQASSLFQRILASAVRLGFEPVGDKLPQPHLTYWLAAHLLARPAGMAPPTSDPTTTMVGEAKPLFLSGNRKKLAARLTQAAYPLLLGW